MDDSRLGSYLVRAGGTHGAPALYSFLRRELIMRKSEGSLRYDLADLLLSSRLSLWKLVSNGATIRLYGARLAIVLKHRCVFLRPGASLSYLNADHIDGPVLLMQPIVFTSDLSLFSYWGSQGTFVKILEDL